VDLSGPIGLVLALQVIGVATAFVLAGRRSQRTQDPAPPPVRTSDAGTNAPSGPLASEQPELAGLYAQRQRLEHELAEERAARAGALATYVQRRRALLSDLQELRRGCSERAAEQHALTAQVSGLTAEVEHLAQRRDSLTAALAASTTSANVLAERTGVARRRLAGLKLEHERITVSRRREVARLEDLARRQALLEAENAELSSLLEILQQLTGGPSTLTRISDTRAAPTPTGQPASTASAARRPETIAPWMEPVSTWSPATHT